MNLFVLSDILKRDLISQASQPLPVQVIADVDMVKGKTTLIRIPVTFKSVLSNDTITPNVTVYWNGTFDYG